MEHVVSPQTYIPIRKTPEHKAEQVSQLLFGETAKVQEKLNGWLHIKTVFDNYEGWIEEKVIHFLSQKIMSTKIVKGYERLVRPGNDSVWLSTGSEIHPEALQSDQEFLIKPNPELDETNVIELAEQFLGSPYLWGGRTFMGIDCSGLIQVVYKAIGKNLPRDASQQVSLGQNVPLVSQAAPGDLAFFDDEEGQITHVGILMDSSNIIHASGSVRIDRINQQGVFNQVEQKYTHTLRVIKRVL